MTHKADKQPETRVEETGNIHSSLDKLFSDAKQKLTSMRPRLLVAEDNDAIREVLVCNLEQAGYDVRGVGDGREAIKIAHAWIPDLILLDIDMPVMNGLMACKLIKRNENPNISRIPVAMLTAQRDKDAVFSAAEAGANGYILKPFETDRVKKKI